MRFAAKVLLALFAIFLSFPVIMVVFGAFRMDDGMLKMPPEIIPNIHDLTLKNWIVLFRYEIIRWTANTLFVALCSTVGMLCITTMAAYAFAKKRFPGKEILFWIFFATMMIPGTVTFIPRFVLMVRLKLIGTLASLIIPNGFSIYYMFFLRQYLTDIPQDMIDTAMIDGASEYRQFVSIVIPLSIPALATVALLTVLGHWYDFLTPLTLLFDRAKYTIVLGIQQVLYDDAMQRQQEWKVNYGLMMAGGMYLMLPGILMFTFFHRYLAHGLWGDSIK